MTSGPSHGTVTFKRGTTFPYFQSPNPREVCNTRRVPSLNAEYHPEAGYVGTDSVTIDAIYPGGTDREDTFTINVK